MCERHFLDWVSSCQITTVDISWQKPTRTLAVLHLPSPWSSHIFQLHHLPGLSHFLESSPIKHPSGTRYQTCQIMMVPSKCVLFWLFLFRLICSFYFIFNLFYLLAGKSWYACGGQRTTFQTRFFPLYCGVLGSNSGPQMCAGAPNHWVFPAALCFSPFEEFGVRLCLPTWIPTRDRNAMVSSFLLHGLYSFLSPLFFYY